MSDTTVVPDTKEWKALQTHYESARALKLRDLFAADPSGGLALIFAAQKDDRVVDKAVSRRDTAPSNGISSRRTLLPCRRLVDPP